jgi:serine/threonine protein kinase
MSQLRHYNTVAVYDYGRSPDGVFYFAMEYLEGISVDVLHERYGVQPPGRVIAIVIQLCGALHEAHQRGFVHGNLKPTNIILCERAGLGDVAKLTDFGFAPVDATPARDLRTLHALAVALVGAPLATRPIDECFAKASSAKHLSALLRSLGTHGWTPADARAWWTAYRKTSAPFLPVPTTLAVDLGRRAAGATLDPRKV